MINLGLPSYVDGMTGDKSLSKAVNRGLLLDILRRRGTASRASLAKESGLNKATVSSQIGELIEMGVIKETGGGESEAAGRKPIMLSIDGPAGYAAGVSLSRETLRLVTLNLAGETLRDDLVALTSSEPDYVFGVLRAALDQAVREAPPSRFGLFGIGVAVPGAVDARSDLVARSTKLGWTNVDLRSRIEEAYGCLVHIGNDATLATVAERDAGGAEERDLLCVFVDDGIGAGAYINGVLHYGHNGMFGEVGHMTMVHGGRACPCGNIGCWDIYGSERALREALARADGADGLPDVETMLKLARELPDWSRRAFSEFVSYLASGTVSLINGLAPAAVSINCDVLSASPALFEELMAGVSGRVSTFNRSCPVRLSSVGKQAPARGACLSAVERYFGALVREGTR